MALSVTEPELWAIEDHIAGIGILDVFGSFDLDLDPITFIYELDPYCVKIYRMYKNELLTFKFSKVIESYRLTDRHTARHTDRQNLRKL